MKAIDVSEGPVTTNALETVLLNFCNLSMDTTVCSVAKKLERMHSVIPEKSVEETQSDCPLPRVSLRYFPYKVPRRFLFALKRQRQRNNQISAADSAFSYENSLLNARLVGCDFGGQSLAPDTKVFTCERQTKPTKNGRLNCSASPVSPVFSSYRTIPLRPSPCCLQHLQSSAQCSSTAMGMTNEDDTRNKCEQSQQQQQTRDLVLAELTDYFQHFVCLCSPRMSDQAQSMYA